MGSILISWKPAFNIDGQILSINEKEYQLAASDDHYRIENISEDSNLDVSLQSVKNGFKSAKTTLVATYKEPPKPDFRFIFNSLSKLDVILLINQHFPLTKQIDIGKISDSLKSFGVLSWLEYNKFLSDKAVNIYKHLEQLYIQDHYSMIWYSLFLKQKRLELLSGQTENNTISRPNHPYIYAWRTPVQLFDNILTSPISFWSGSSGNKRLKLNPTELKAELSKFPVGHKTFRLADIVVGIQNEIAYFFDGVVNNTYPSIWMDLWKTYVSNLLDGYFSECKALGIELDFVFSDIEEQKNVFYFRQEKNPSGENLPYIDVQKDSRWQSFKNKHLIDFDVSTMNTWDASRDVRTHRWNAATFQDIQESIYDAIYKTLEKYYPNVQYSSYHSWEYAGGIYPIGDSAGSSYSPIGCGFKGSSDNVYNTRAMYATSGKMWWPHLNNNVVHEISPWHGLIRDYFKIAATVAASKGPFSFWIQNPSHNNDRIGEYGYVHLLMSIFMADNNFYWNGSNSGATAADDKLISDAAYEVFNEIKAISNNRGKAIEIVRFESLPTSHVEMSKEFGDVIKTLRINRSPVSHQWITESREDFYRRN